MHPDDVTASATTYAILTPNTVEPDEIPKEPNGTVGNNGDFATPALHPFNTLGLITPDLPNKAAWRNWENWRLTINDLQTLTGLNFFSNISEDIQRQIKASISPVIPINAPLLADTESGISSLNVLSSDSTIGHDGVAQGDIPSTTSQVSISQVSTSQINTIYSNGYQFGTTQIGVNQFGSIQVGAIQVSIPQISTFQVSTGQDSTTQISATQINTLHIGSSQISTTQVDATKVIPAGIIFTNSSDVKVDSTQINSTKISLPSSVTPQQFLSVHTLTPESITTINNTAQTLWNTLLQPQTPFDINLQLTSSLAKGQLAEAIVTKYDNQGRPIGGTIEVDPTANGLGWFIDPTITDPTEFSQTLSQTASRATTNSDAYGHYDLLTALLHEMAHLAGFISGNSSFDRHVQTVASSRLFVGDNFTAPLTNDGSHLDPKTYAYDLLNPTLTPGIRELPSQIDIDILKEVRSNSGVIENTATQAALNSSPLTDILNGQFDTSDTTDSNYGWTTRGAAKILSKEAVLTEDSPLNSEFKQTFTVPQGAKYLEFTLKDTTLGNESAIAPGDAFEVALLDANEKTSLVDTVNGLTRADSFLNIQHDGTAYFSNEWH